MNYIKGTLILAVLIFALALSAHSPSNIQLTFDDETALLSISITHNVRNTENHYISELTVDLGGERIITHKLSEQETTAGIDLSYRLPDIKDGVSITVTASCNRVGRMTRTLNREKEDLEE